MCIFKKPEPKDLKPESIIPANATNWDEVYSLITTKFPPNLWWNGQTRLFLSDGKDYYRASYNDLAKFLAQDQTNKYQYEAEVFDCDDFSYRLMGQFSAPPWSALCFGIIWTDRHALNIAITEDKKIVFIEPQNDEVQTELKSWQGNKISLIVM